MADLPRFRNRAQAGKQLAGALAAEVRGCDAIVLALPRGGVPVGFAVAMTLGLALDILIVRKLGLPAQPEFAIGAVGSGGVRVLQPGVPGLMGVTQDEVEAIAARELAEIGRRARLYRGERPEPDLAGRTVLLVDDGIATGSTMLAAVEVARRRRAARVLVAAPVAPPATLASLRAHADGVACLLAPPRFFAVGQWYERFDQTSDEEVQDLLAMAWRSRATGQIETQPNREERT
ncbi:phosphoribosyltransferase [Massilia sp. Dwa41.01b]|uniref:phosphoribosyltransferase n=2 Tax=unclassified Massilia TaxID=2609279 RepID=UPI0015FF1C66|nr:phosphoribosyltransferase [Massilia sp. Dwa41.01b]QNA89469.1 phosphoribosyltransferase [Massilia sp. Dwa41.01b]QNB01473.1 phosphoribosyltransferase [Massilia sp. Se16.2.3]